MFITRTVERQLPDKLQFIHPSLHIPDEPESAAIKPQLHSNKGSAALFQRLGNTITKAR